MGTIQEVIAAVVLMGGKEITVKQVWFKRFSFLFEQTKCVMMRHILID